MLRYTFFFPIGPTAANIYTEACSIRHELRLARAVQVGIPLVDTFDACNQLMTDRLRQIRAVAVLKVLAGSSKD